MVELQVLGLFGFVFPGVGVEGLGFRVYPRSLSKSSSYKSISRLWSITIRTIKDYSQDHISSTCPCIVVPTATLSFQSPCSSQKTAKPTRVKGLGQQVWRDLE